MAIKPALRYAILANPASGVLPMHKRQRLLKDAASVLQADIYGLDTTSAEALARCAREKSRECDVLVVAGGDGTFSLVANAVDLSSTPLAFLPFGTGNALVHALGYQGGLSAIADRIRKAAIHELDLIDCSGRKKGFMTSLGIDGTMIQRYNRLRSKGFHGLTAHVLAGLIAYFKAYRCTDGTLAMDGHSRQVQRILSLMVVKQPFFGMGLKTVPRARWDDARLHTLMIPARTHVALAALATGFTVGNRFGSYQSGTELHVRLNKPLSLQIDGEFGWTSDWFAFRVLPGVLKLKY